MSVPPIDSVRGGSHGVTAGYEQMMALALTYGAEADGLAELARLGPRVMADPDMVESSVLSPTTFADAEAAVLGTTAGAQGLLGRCAGLAADGLLVSATVDAFRVSDAVSRAAAESIDHALGSLLLVGTLASVPPGAASALATAGALLWPTLGTEEREAFSAALADRLGAVVLEHPELVEHLTNAQGGLIDSLVPGGAGWLNPSDGPITSATTGDAARLMALLFGDRTDVQVARVDDRDPGDGAPDETVATVRDLMARLAVTNALDREDESMRGAIRVETVTVDGRQRHIVYLPGTDDLSPVPAGGGTARDMLTNYQLLGGLDSSYGRGIREAMRDAGLAGEEVMLVGHSQGGMAAVALAADPQFSKEFSVRHVVTAGAPVAHVVDLPRDVSALHLENRGDAVPLLDGERNPEARNRVTVTFDEGSRDVPGNHSMERYVSGGAAVDASESGSLRDLLEQLRRDGFLGGRVERSSTYVISRP